MAKAEDSRPAAGPAAGKGGGAAKKAAIWGLAVLILSSGAGAAFLLLNGGLDQIRQGIAQPSEGGGPSTPVSKDPAQYISLDPPFVVNFSDQGILRYLQVSVSAMTRDKAVAQAAASNMPQIRNDLILLFGSQSFETLSSTEGKEGLRAQALEQIQGILRQEIGVPGVEAVYFTNFVMQ